MHTCNGGRGSAPINIICYQIKSLGPGRGYTFFASLAKGFPPIDSPKHDRLLTTLFPMLQLHSTTLLMKTHMLVPENMEKAGAHREVSLPTG